MNPPASASKLPDASPVPAEQQQTPKPGPTSDSVLEGHPTEVPTTPFIGSQPKPPAIRHFDRYELQELSQGGMSVVYRAHDTLLGRTVALKMMRAGIFATADDVTRFRCEAQAIAQLEHRHIIKIYEVGHAEGQDYFTMPYLADGSLAQHLKQHRMEAPAAAALMEKVARAVQYAHEHNILHRDLKPGNVLLDDEGEPMVADFGLAKFLASDLELTRTGDRPGTVPYMAPEQLADSPGPVTVQTDVWALGVMLYELLAGRRPFGGSSREAMTRAIRSGKLPELSTLQPKVDRTLESIVRKCLAVDPRQRYASALEVAEDLHRWSQGWRLPPESWLARMVQTLRRPLVLLALVGVAIVVGVLIWAVATGKFTRQPEMVLIGDDGKPQGVLWMLGEEGSQTSAVGGGEGFLVRCPKTGIVELLAVPPWPSYRFEAQVRHDVDFGLGAVGLCYAFEQAQAGNDIHRRYAKLQSAEHEPRFCIVQGKLKCTLHTPQGLSSDASSPLGLRDQDPGRPGAWRQLAVEVTAASIRTFWEGTLLHEVTREQWLEKAQSLSDKFPALPPPQYPPSGALGLFIDRSQASFRHVVVTRLPEHN
jgi:tRNA A-37 threonylcarbamoyl transferase component Bud32